MFFFPGVLALTFAGYRYAGESWRYHEVSVYSPADIPIFPLKTLIPVAGATLLLQGLAEVFRCIICLRDRRMAAARAGRRGTRDRDPARARIRRAA